MGRIEKYKAKMDSDVLKRRYDDTKELAVENKAPSVKREVEIELKVKTLCDGEASILHHYYMVYGKELVKNKTESEWGITFDKWETRGLVPQILNNISVLLVGYNQIGEICLFDVGRFDVNIFG